jgi:hypothetical protein
MKVKPMQRIKVFRHIVLHPEKAQDAQQSLKLIGRSSACRELGDMIGWAREYIV